MVKSVDTLVSGTSERKLVEVRVLFQALTSLCLEWMRLMEEDEEPPEKAERIPGAQIDRMAI